MKRLFYTFLLCLLFFLVGCKNEEKTKTTSTEEKTKQESKDNEHEKEQSEEMKQKIEQVEKVVTTKIPFSQDEQKIL
jgi:major membrane immunogen (membrane-anchored lipoprotein)